MQVEGRLHPGLGTSGMSAGFKWGKCLIVALAHLRWPTTTCACNMNTKPVEPTPEPSSLLYVWML